MVPCAAILYIYIHTHIIFFYLQFLPSSSEKQSCQGSMCPQKKANVPGPEGISGQGETRM